MKNDDLIGAVVSVCLTVRLQMKNDCSAGGVEEGGSHTKLWKNKRKKKTKSKKWKVENFSLLCISRQSEHLTYPISNLRHLLCLCVAQRGYRGGYGITHQRVCICLRSKWWSCSQIIKQSLH